MTRLEGPRPAPPRPALLALAWPMLAELLLGFAVALLGLWLAARSSDTAAAAFSLSNQALGAFFLLFRIVSMGASVVITQALGAGQPQAAQRSALAALGASSWLGLAAALAVHQGAGTLLGWLDAPPAVAAQAEPYLQALALAVLLDSGNACMAAVMRAHLRTRDTMLNILAMHALHLLLCAPLMRQFGLVGFAWAMAASRLLGLAVHLWLWRLRLDLHPRASDFLRLQPATLAPMLHIGLPGAAETIAYRLATLVAMTALSGMGTHALATHSYAWQVTTLVVLYSLALGLAGEILLGHLVGAGRLKQADRLLRRTLAFGLAGAMLAALAAALSARWTLGLFTQDLGIVTAATTLLWINLLLEPGRTVNVIVINALRAAGDARYPVAVGAVSMVVVMAGGSWWLGVHLGWGLSGVWLAFAADEWLRGALMAARWHSRAWVPAARRARRRLRAAA